MVQHKSSKATKIRTYLESNPTATPAEVASKLKVNAQYVYVIRNLMKKSSGVNIDTVYGGTQTSAPPAPDMVNHPPHYTDGGIETIDFIEAKKLDYHLGNAVKYITRAGKKADALEDLKKAQWYLNRAIDARRGA